MKKIVKTTLITFSQAFSNVLALKAATPSFEILNVFVLAKH